MVTRTRFAPSPTGYLHIGGARTAIFNWLYAKHECGKFILRIEDTDYERSTSDSASMILDGMSWLGLSWDEGPFYQSERLDTYRSYVEQLLDMGRAYPCYCTKEELSQEREERVKRGERPRYNRRCLTDPPVGRKDHVIRFRCEEGGVTELNDLIKGKVTFNNSELDDLILVRSDGIPTYNFTVVVDDALMQITHVFRGDDHLNNSPRQIQIYKALGFPLPAFGHVPMILGTDRTRLSKRHGAMSVTAYRDMGYLPEGVVNYLVRLGWSHGDQEIFSLDELTELFSFEQIGKSAGEFNPEKMQWVNHQHLKSSAPENIAEMAVPHFKERGVDPSDHPRYVEAVTTLMERSKTLEELADSGLFYFTDSIDVDDGARKKFLNREVLPPLSSLVDLLEGAEPFDEETISAAFNIVMSQHDIKLGKIAQPCRVALTGRRVSPGIFEIIRVLGKRKTVERIREALRIIELDSHNLRQ